MSRMYKFVSGSQAPFMMTWLDAASNTITFLPENKVLHPWSANSPMETRDFLRSGKMCACLASSGSDSFGSSAV